MNKQWKKREHSYEYLGALGACSLRVCRPACSLTTLVCYYQWVRPPIMLRYRYFWRNAGRATPRFGPWVAPPVHICTCTAWNRQGADDFLSGPSSSQQGRLRRRSSAQQSRLHRKVRRHKKKGRWHRLGLSIGIEKPSAQGSPPWR
jgi:hypothetical protein